MEGKQIEEGLEERIATEVQIAAGTNVSKIHRFRCHTGHGYTEDALLEAIMQGTGESIWQVTRGLQETVMLLQHMGKHLQEAGERSRAGQFFEKAQELEERASRFQELAREHESMSGNKLEMPEGKEER